MKWQRNKRGYYQRRFGGVMTYRHRWMWEQAHGPIPPDHDVDHKNGIPGDDWLDNLQCVPHGTNLRLGSANLVSNNTSGFTGVSKTRTGKWCGKFNHDGVTIRCGASHLTPEAAHNAITARRAELNAQTRRP